MALSHAHHAPPFFMVFLRNPYPGLSDAPFLLGKASNRLMKLRNFLILLVAFLSVCLRGAAQTSTAAPDDVEQLKQLVFDLEHRVAVLEQQNQQLRSTTAPSDSTGPQTAAALVLASEELRASDSTSFVPAQQTATTAPRPRPFPARSPAAPPSTTPSMATTNTTSTTYGRVNDLRAYDVLSNVFSINQADFIFDLDPDLTAQRRYGFRVDLQFGQATETLQGNPANEMTRPEIYRNIFQAYGTYIAPVGHGIEIRCSESGPVPRHRGQLHQRPA